MKMKYGSLVYRAIAVVLPLSSRVGRIAVFLKKKKVQGSLRLARAAFRDTLACALC